MGNRDVRRSVEGRGMGRGTQDTTIVSQFLWGEMKNIPAIQDFVKKKRLEMVHLSPRTMGTGQCQKPSASQPFPLSVVSEQVLLSIEKIQPSYNEALFSCPS